MTADRDPLFGAFLDPRGRIRTASRDRARAARPRSLAGVRVGLLWNGKRNAELLVAQIGRLLAEQYDAVVAACAEPYAHAVPLDVPDLAGLVDRCDVTVVGVGDCASCAAAAVADGMAIERQGAPAAVICSDAFVRTARATAAVQGDPGFAFLTTPHPVAALSAHQVAGRATRLLPEVVALLTEEAG